ncbi:hypothetical protein [Flavobacterium sp. 5]|uniref:hypothetical protein n=1 Tax=Flavobacterium sp. 5 TaxID=2035199 RepID=UPI000C2C7CDD|nr:hypothetical protein [Flavobacterium sp. 5]PKB15425.1 hypothetical protein CLU82_0499 [Flavobacterium sp. 5]
MNDFEENTLNDEKIKYHKRIIYIGLLAFAVLSIWTITELNGFENGLEDAEIWAPIGFVYDNFGYWSAVLISPLLGLLVLFSNVKSIMKLKENKIKN